MSLQTASGIVHRRRETLGASSPPTTSRTTRQRTIRSASRVVRQGFTSPVTSSIIIGIARVVTLAFNIRVIPSVAVITFFVSRLVLLDGAIPIHIF